MTGPRASDEAAGALSDAETMVGTAESATALTAGATPVVATEATTTLAASREERLVPYGMIAVGALCAALLSGRPALAALAAPFALALVVGLRHAGSLRVTARMMLDADQVLEGDVVTGRIELEWEGAVDARVLVRRLTGVAPASPDAPLAWSLPDARGRAELPVRLRATHWGRHATGDVWLRVDVPFGLVSWTGKVLTGPTLRVLPGAERLDRLLDPAESRTVLGAHRTPRFGDGDEFAELRPYVPGDRLRDLNWRATARHRRPIVNRHHPELSGEVVIAIDPFVDWSAGSTEALARAARAAWALAAIHLSANDRVGLVTLGGRTRRLHPAGGRRARYELLETLLQIGGELADATARHGGDILPVVPAAALVVALTPLQDRRTLRALHGWRARGRAVAAVVIDTRDLLGEPASTADALARRLWSITLDRRRYELAEAGIPVVSITGDGPIAPVVAALRRARRTPAVRRVR